jgi:hypothetical protein
MLTDSLVSRRPVRVFAAGALLWTTFALADPPAPPPPAPEGATRDELLRALIEHSRLGVTLDERRLAGPGAERLARLAADAQFVLMGESHGSEGVADFATAVWALLRPLGYTHAAIETDPWVAERLEQTLRAEGLDAWARFLGERGGAAAAPFVTWAPEVRLAQAIIASAPQASGPSLWGLDQVFIGSAGWLLQEVAVGASAPRARGLAEALATQATEGGLNGLASLETARLAALRDALSAEVDSDWRDLVEAMVLSQEIYRPFTGGAGEAYLANDARERLMRRLFIKYYERAAAAGQPPRVLLKFGANHMYRGASPVQVQGLGGFVSEFAAARGAGSLSLLVLCGPGGQSGDLSGRASDCGEELAKGDWGFLLPYVESGSPTLFDLRSWRLRPGRFKHLPAEVQRAVGSFDFLVFVPGAASAFLPGVAPLAATP